MVWLTGDKHGFWYELKPSLEKLNEGDTLIVLGDFGFIFYSPQYKRNWWLREEKHLRKAQKLCEEKNIKLLFIDGNHENFYRLDKYENTTLYGGNVHKINENIFHLKRGQVFTIEGKKFFTFGGANSIDRSDRIIDNSWWKEETPTYEQINIAMTNIELNNFKVDYILTHTIFDELIPFLDLEKLNIKNDFNSFFLELKEKVDFDKWYFGHFHVDKNLGKYECLHHNTIPLEDK